MFEAKTHLEILRYLGWSINRRQEVLDALNAAEANSVLETEVKEILERLSSISQSLQTEMGSVNAGLIKVESLEWESSASRTEGMAAVKQGLTEDLANLLGLEWTNFTIELGRSMTIGIEVN